MMKSKRKYYPSYLPIILIICILAFTGCSNYGIPNYDQIIDQTVASLQTKINTFLIKMERTTGTPEGEYVNNTQFYDEVQGTLDSLSTRATTLSNNETIVTQIGHLKENIERLRTLHEKQGKDGLTPFMIKSMKTAFDEQFTWIIKLEYALKDREASKNQ